jgi:hypothetical protein
MNAANWDTERLNLKKLNSVEVKEKQPDKQLAELCSLGELRR